MRSFFVVLLGIILVPFVLVTVGSLVVPPDVNPHAHYYSDRDGCLRQAGIRKEPVDYYMASKKQYAPRYAVCMAQFGYKGEDLVP